MIVIGPDPLVLEVLDFLRSKFSNIPPTDELESLELRIAVNECVTFRATTFAQLKEPKT